MKNSFDFTFELSPNSVQQLTNNLKKYYKEVINCREYILKALTDRALELVKENIRNTTKGTGELESSVKSEIISKEMARVYTDLFYAQFVEYGTGIIGKGNPSPKAQEIGWTYDTNEHGEKGWVYKSESGDFYWTSGEVAHNYMYNTLMKLKEEYIIIARNVLKERGVI